MLIKALFGLTLLLGTNDCSIDLGNLDDLVITYEISVSNDSLADGGEAARVSVSGADVNRQAILEAGGSLVVRAFAGRSVTISADATGDYLAEMRERQEGLAALLDTLESGGANWLEVYADIVETADEIRAWQTSDHGDTCNVDLKVGEDGKGEPVDVGVSWDGQSFHLEC